MKYYNFRVDIYYPLDEDSKINDIIRNIKKIEGVEVSYYMEESAPPPNMLKEFLIITANSLIILKTLFEIQKIIDKKKGKVYIRSNGESFDLEAYNIDELKVKFGEPSISRYYVKIDLPHISPDELKKTARSLGYRPIYFNGRLLSENSRTLFTDYNEKNHIIDVDLQIGDKEINSLYEKGSPIFAKPEEVKVAEGTPREWTSFNSLQLSLNETPNASKIIQVNLGECAH